jgi:hypothetical protein
VASDDFGLGFPAGVGGRRLTMKFLRRVRVCRILGCPFSPAVEPAPGLMTGGGAAG